MLPGGRSGRIVETISAGQFVVEVTGVDWIGRLSGAGVLDRTQVEAAQLLALLWEQSGLRPRVGCGYDGRVDTSATGRHHFEEMTGSELKAWRRLTKALAAAPASSRGDIEGLCFWDTFEPVALGRLRFGLDAAARALGLRTR